MRLVDRLLLGAGTPLLLAGLVWGGAGASPPAPRRAALPQEAVAVPSAGPGPGRGLPPGVRIDKTTLMLVAPHLEPFPGSVLLTWQQLQKVTYEEGLEGMPEEIRALDGHRVTMAGFLLTTVEYDDIKEFSLVASHFTCCFGMVPGLNGWVHVKLEPGQVGLPNTSEPLSVCGIFRIREEKQAGYVTSIFALDDAEARIIGW